MKKIILLLPFILVICIICHAQGVKFESGTWSEMLAKAKAENKTIFIDVYTKWCGPCKHVSENVFPQEKLGNIITRISSITRLMQKAPQVKNS